MFAWLEWLICFLLFLNCALLNNVLIIIYTKTSLLFLTINILNYHKHSYVCSSFKKVNNNCYMYVYHSFVSYSTHYNNVFLINWLLIFILNLTMLLYIWHYRGLVRNSSYTHTLCTFSLYIAIFQIHFVNRNQCMYSNSQLLYNVRAYLHVCTVILRATLKTWKMSKCV